MIDPFETATGGGGYLLWWRFPASFGDSSLDIFFVESWLKDEAGTYVLTGITPRGSYPAWRATLEAAVRTACAD